MFLTKKCDYAIRVVRSLADMKLRTVKCICDHEFVPHPFAYKILKRLERAGIVRSHRGAAGGYSLVRPLDSITLYDIVTAIDEQLYVSECMRYGYACPHRSSGNTCGVHKEFSRLQDMVLSAMSEKKISDIFTDN